jgi:hypothetical protein
MRISYGKFLQLLEGNRVKRVVVYGDMKTAIVEVRQTGCISYGRLWGAARANTISGRLEGQMIRTHALTTLHRPATLTPIPVTQPCVLLRTHTHGYLVGHDSTSPGLCC